MPLGEIFVKLVVGFPRDPKVRALARYGEDAGLARDLYVQMLLYCKENLSDGWVPVEEIGVLAYPLPMDHANQLAKQLASVGLINELSKGEAEGWHVNAYVKRNGSKADVERLSQVRAEAGRKGGRPASKPAGQKPGKATGNQVGKQNKSRPNPETETETETSKDQNHLAGAERADVERLCVHLADRIEANGNLRPSITKQWRDSARLILDRDKRTEEQAHRAIDWCQDSDFWCRNVMSMPTLRKQYDRLRMEADAEQRKRGPSGSAAPPKQTSFSDEEYESGW